MESLLSDDLLRQLMAVGQVDVVVGVPTLNNAATAGAVVRAVHLAFTRRFKRDRTVLINFDAGSTDGTPDIVRRASLVESETLVAPQALRTIHRISSPYHGLPGKGGALRALFAAAELMDAKAVALFDPDATTMTADWVAHLVGPVYRDGFDYVAPVFTRHPTEGPLVTQLARPLVRTAYGRRMREPLSSEFGCSLRFASHCLAQDVWSSAFLTYGIDIWLATTALAGGFQCGEAVLGARSQEASPHRPALPELFRQVVGTLFTCMEMHQPYWLGREGSEELPRLTDGDLWSPEATLLDPAPLAESFRNGVRDLRPVLETILDDETRAEVERVATAPQPVFPDELWIEAVVQFAAAHHREVMHRDHTIRALVPLYLGRAASFLTASVERDASAVEEDLGALALGFEKRKPQLVRRWKAEEGS
jgi:glucosylglycerate synthase